MAQKQGSGNEGSSDMGSEKASPPGAPATPTDAASSKLEGVVSALGARWETALAAVNSRLDTHAALLQSRLDGVDGKVEAVNEKLHPLNAKVDEANESLEELEEAIEDAHFEWDKNTRELILHIWGVGAFVTGAVVLAVVVIMNGQRASQAATPAVSYVPAKPPAQEIIVHVTPESAHGFVVPPQCAYTPSPYQDGLGDLITGPTQVGPKLPERWVPNGMAANQKPAPCDASLGETAINGGCWVYIADVPPPCGRLYQYENRCYRPVAADPKPAVGDETHPSSKKQR